MHFTCRLVFYNHVHTVVHRTPRYGTFLHALFVYRRHNKTRPEISCGASAFLTTERQRTLTVHPRKIQTICFRSSVFEIIRTEKIGNCAVGKSPHHQSEIRWWYYDTVSTLRRRTAVRCGRCRSHAHKHTYYQALSSILFSGRGGGGALERNWVMLCHHSMYHRVWNVEFRCYLQ